MLQDKFREVSPKSPAGSTSSTRGGGHFCGPGGLDNGSLERMVSALEQRLAPSITRAIAVELDSRGGHGKRRTGGANDAGGAHPKRRAAGQCQAVAEAEPARTRSQGPAANQGLAAGDVLQAAGPSAPQQLIPHTTHNSAIPHTTKRRGSRHSLPEALSDRPLECVADWSHEQSMAC